MDSVGFLGFSPPRLSLTLSRLQPAPSAAWGGWGRAAQHRAREDDCFDASHTPLRLTGCLAWLPMHSPQSPDISDVLCARRRQYIVSIRRAHIPSHAAQPEVRLADGELLTSCVVEHESRVSCSEAGGSLCG